MSKKNRNKPLRSGVNYFIKGMKGHNAVEDIYDLGNDLFKISRTNGRTDLKVLLVDIYIMGELDIYEIDPKSLGIDCIVLIGFYNKYSYAAKYLAKSMDIGLFENREFFGAINLTNKAFINYERKG